MDKIRQVVSGAIKRFAFICLAALCLLVLGDLALTVYGKWSKANFRVRITEMTDLTTRISWGPMRRDEFLGSSLFKGGDSQYFFQTYPSYFVSRDGIWEGLIVPETVLEHLAGRIRLLFALRAEQPVFEVRRGKLYQLVLSRPTWRSRLVEQWESWEEKVPPSDDVAWALQQARGYLRYHQRGGA